jgi:nucleoside 2-deoxyribosyltransferase
VSPVQRAALSHAIRVQEHGPVPRLTSDWIDRFFADATLPGVDVQVGNIIRMVGERMSSTGESHDLAGAADAARVGAFSRRRMDDLVSELVESGTLKVIDMGMSISTGDSRIVQPASYGLTLQGWERFERERHGKLAGNYGFIALKFGDADLDELVDKTIKPALLRETGYRVVDLRNVARAGVIDNILREQIRDAAFVLVDLTHDNAGAYWEAGYAEGLGKPVIYLCERAKFDRAKTHFDTNHCTTVMWAADAIEDFERALVATVRRSLNLFESRG